MMKILMLLICMGIPLTSFAQRSSMGFYGSIAAKAGMGTAADAEEENVESRDLWNYGAEVNLGLRFGNLIVAGAADYVFWNQRTDAKEAGNTDVSGTQLSFSPTVGYAIGNFLFQGKVPLYSTVTLSEEDQNGNPVKYTDAKFPGYGIQIKYRMGPRTFLGLEYSTTTYEKMEIDGKDTKLDSDSEVTYSAWGLMYGLYF